MDEVFPWHENHSLRHLLPGAGGVQRAARCGGAGPAGIRFTQIEQVAQDAGDHPADEEQE